MARTDIRAVDGLPAAIDRAKALVDAGADAIFPEAMADLGEFEAMREAIDVPILANMTEFGKSELFTNEQLAGVGINIVIYPVSLLRIAMGAAERGLDTIVAKGPCNSEVAAMQTRARLYELLDYEAYNAFDTSVFNFQVPAREAREHLHDRPEIHKGLAGVVVDTTAISKVNPETNSLLYRGYPVQELAEKCTFEEVAYLLWNGELPTTDAAGRTSRSRSASLRALDRAVKRVIDELPLTAHPMDVVRTAVSVIGANDPDAADSSPESNLGKSHQP